MRRLLLVFSALLLILSCSPGEKQPVQSPKSTQAKLVKVTTVSPKTLVEKLELPGTIRAENVANILSTAEGKISKLFVREGEQVLQNQVVVLISPLIREDIINSARLLVEAKREVLTKNPADPVLQKELQQAEEDYQFALQQYREIPVTSPIDGVVSKRWVDIGDMVPAKQKLFEIQSSKRLRVDVSVSELDIRKLRLQQDVQILADACPEKVFKGKISRIHPQIDTQTRNGLVEVKLLNPCPNLQAGMFVRTVFVVRVLKDVLAIPVPAVIDRPKARTCFIVNGNKAEEVTLQTGLVDGEWVEIRSGLSVGDKVVVEGQQQLKSGTPVKIQNK
ncbi:MAG: efflux RND transporter periplasmic adaptor subunit [Calditrichia bacterium]